MNHVAVAEQILDMMADLVCDYVGLREFGFGAAEPLFQFVEEGGVEIYRLVGRTIKRPDGGRSRAALGRHAICFEHWSYRQNPSMGDIVHQFREAKCGFLHGT